MTGQAHWLSVAGLIAPLIVIAIIAVAEEMASRKLRRGGRVLR